MDERRCVVDLSAKPTDYVPKCSRFLHDGIYNGLLKACCIDGAVHEISLMEMRQTERCGCCLYREKEAIPESKRKTPEYLRKLVVVVGESGIHKGSDPVYGKASR